MSHGSLTPGDMNHDILDISTDFINRDNKLKDCKNHYIHKQIIDTIEIIISNHITMLKIKNILLDIKHEVENKLNTNNKCDKHVIEYYFEKKYEIKSKNVLFGKSTLTRGGKTTKKTRKNRRQTKNNNNIQYQQNKLHIINTGFEHLSK
jgi:hypothetical protein